jgi:hypothetical protein
MKAPSIFWVLFLAINSRSGLMAQTTLATVTGLVTDAKGAAVPSVKIELTNTDTNLKYAGLSNETGQYTVSGMQNGPYTFRALSPGFALFVIADVQLVERDMRRIDVNLELGAVQTTVEVDSRVSLIETESARISDVKDHDVIWNAPLFLHRTADIINMAPMATSNNYGYRVGGARNHQEEMVWDGISGASSTGAMANGSMSDRTEAIQEVRIEAAGNNAEFGTVGQISLVSRAGTNQIHGSAFDLYITPNWSARNPFALARTQNLQHQPGGTLGGPVYIPRTYDGRNRTFFFAGIEFERFGGATVTVFNPTVPLAAWRNGDFSGLLPGTVVRDPFAGNAPFPGNAIPAARLNPVAFKLQDQFYPLPNFGNTSVLNAGNYRNLQYYALPTNPTATLRVDHKFSDKAWIYGRMTRLVWDNSGPPGTLDTYPVQGRYKYDSQYGLSFTYMITPALVSETHYGYSSDDMPILGGINGLRQVKELGLSGLAPNLPDLTGMYTVQWSGLGLSQLGGAGYQCDPCNHAPVHLGYESLSWFHGTHSVKAGFEFRRNDFEFYAPSTNMFGTNVFSNRFTGFPYSDFLLGIPTTAQRAFAPIKQSAMERQYAVFLQDQFRWSPKLTVNYGVRWEIKSPWTEANDLLSVFDPKTGKIVVPDSAMAQVSPLMPVAYIGVIRASEAGYPQSLIHGHNKQFAPRLGIAWRPLGNSFVLRGGIGIYYDNYMDRPTTTGVPYSLAEPAFTNPTGNPAIILPQVFPAASAALTSVAIPAAYDPNLRSPYSIQFNAAAEKQFGNMAVSLTFVSTASREITYARDLNQPLPGLTPYVLSARPFPGLPNISYFGNGAGHQYRAGSLEVRRAFSNGLWLQAYYTWARDIGDIDIGGTVENAFDRRRDVGVWSNPPTNRLFGAFIYDLPAGKGKRFVPNVSGWLNAMVGGWQLAGNYVYETGFFLTPLWTGPDPTNTRYTTGPAPVVTIRPNILANPNLSNPTIRQWYNVGAFASPSLGAFGTAPAGAIVGPPISAMGATVKKYFRVRERLRVRLEFVATNALNHPLWNVPDLNVTNTATAGRITALAGHGSSDSTTTRQVQLLARVEW